MTFKRVLLFVSLLAIVREIASRHSCDESSSADKNGKLSKADVSDLITAENQERIKMCLTVLGKDPLEAGIAEMLWRDLVKVYRIADDIPEEELRLLGWIAMGIPARDFLNLSLTDVETVAAFGKWRNFSKEQLASIKQAVEYQWSYKTPSDLNSYDLAALGQVLCAFNTSQIAAIQPLAFKAAAGDISNLIDCPEDVVRELASLATDKDAFGDPSEWTAIQIASIGCVIAGLDSVEDIHPDAFEGLAASSMKCLPAETLRAMSTEQLSHLSLSAINALSYSQRSSLDSEQIKAIQGTVITLSSVLNNGGLTWRSPAVTLTTHFTFSTLILFRQI